MMPAQSNHLYDRRKPDVGAEDRGRVAEAPSQTPAKGWRDVLLRVFHGISEDRITTMSAGVTFFVLLAIFPGLTGLISLYGLFADAGAVGQHLDSLAGILPEGGMQILREQLQQLTSQPPQRLGLATVASLAISLWSANGGIKAVFEGSQLGLRREGEARLHQAQCHLAGFYPGRPHLCHRIATDHDGTSAATILSGTSGARTDRGLRAMAGSSDGRRPRYLNYLPVRSEPGSASMALDISGQYLRGHRLDCSFGTLLLVHLAFRQLQQDLWFTWCRSRFHDLDLDLHHGDPDRSQD